MAGQSSRDLPQPILITQGLGEDGSFLQVDVDLPKFAQGKERTAQVEAEINGLCVGVMPFWEMLQRIQRLLEGRRCLMVCRLGHGLGSSLAAVGCSLVPHRALQSVMRQPVDLADELVGVESFEALDNPGMQSPPSFLEEAAVDDLVRQGVRG